MKQVFSKTGGASISGKFLVPFNATWPFAKLRVSPDELTIKVIIVGTYRFAPGEVTSIERHGRIPFFGWGVRIHHSKADYSKKIIFWCFGHPNHLLKEIQDAGFIPRPKQRV